MSQTAAVASALRQCLGGMGLDVGAQYQTDDAPEITVVAYDEAFHNLWDALDSEEPCPARPQLLVLLWNGVPSLTELRLGDAASHLTAYDWLVALALRQPSSENDDLSVVVMDLAASGSSGVFAERMFPFVLEALPWVSVCMTRPRTSQGPQVFPQGRLIPELLQRLGAEKARKTPDCRLSPRDLRDLWALELTRPGDRHAISNFVAPLLLAERIAHPSYLHETVDLQTATPSSDQLRILLGAVGLLEDGSTHQAHTVQIGWVDWPRISALLAKRPFRAVLVDDQTRSGWGEVLCSIFKQRYAPAFTDAEAGSEDGSDGLYALTSVEHEAGQKQRPHVWGSESPEFLVQRLEGLVNEESAEQVAENILHQRFRFHLVEDDDAAEIIFLDLRLFPKSRWKAEQAFLSSLLDVAETLTGLPRERLPWPPVPHAEIAELRAWLRRAPEPEVTSHHRALSLLPRLLALIDPSLPIVVFSSTGRREIVEALKPYGNVVTSFTKPNLTGFASADVLEQCAEQFRAATDRALELVEARLQCRWSVDAENPYPPPLPAADSESNYHVELYIDESGDPKTPGQFWRIGGCFAVFRGNSTSDAREQADRFDDVLVQNGVRFFDWPHNGPQPHNSEVQGKYEPCVRELELGLRAAREDDCAPQCLGLAALSDRTSRSTDFEEGNGEDDAIVNPASGDNLFLLTLERFVELFLYESVPSLLGSASKGASISLFAGWRQRRVESTLEAARSFYRYGVPWVDYRGQILQRTFVEGDLAPLVRDLRLFRRGQYEVHRAVAQHLPYDTENVLAFVCRCCRVSFRRSQAAYLTDSQELEQGCTYTGVVTGFLRGESRDLGFFVAVGGSSGLVHISEIPESQQNNLRQAFRQDQEVNVRFLEYRENGASFSVLDVDQDRKLANRLAVRCPECGRTDRVRPDCRALHYVADQVLRDMYGNGQRLFGRVFEHVVAGEFEESMGAQGKAVIRAGRSLDRGDVAAAVVSLPGPNDTRGEGADHVTSRPAIRDFVRWRIGRALESAPGSTFVRIASDSTAAPGFNWR